MPDKDLLIHYDEDAQEIIFYEVDVATDSKKSAFRVPLSFYKEKAVDEAERTMGETVFTFFDRWSEVKMGLRNYVEESKQALAKAQRQTKTLARKNDPLAQYHFAINCFTEGVRKRSLADIEKAEQWLKKSASNGCDEAIKYLKEHWERDKTSAQRGIKQG